MKAAVGDECSSTLLNSTHFTLNGASWINETLQFNPTLKDYLAQGVFLTQKINIILPWRLQFLFSLTSCESFGDPRSAYPDYIGDGFSLIIHDDSSKNTSFVGEEGSSLGYCTSFMCPNSCAVLFDLYHYSNLMSFSVSDTSGTLMNGMVPPGSGWNIVNGAKCERTFDCIIDYNSTHLSVYLDSEIPWFSYQVNMSSLISSSNGTAYMGWGFGVGEYYYNLVISSVKLFQNCSTIITSLQKEQCNTSILSNHNLTSFFTNNATTQSNSIHLNGSSASVFYSSIVDVTSGWNVSFTVNVSGCSGLCSTFGDGFTFVIHNERAGFGYLGNGGSDLGYFPPVNSMYPKSLAIVFDHSGSCSQLRSFMRVVLNNYRSSPITINAVGLASSNATGALICNQAYQVSISHNATHLSIYFSNKTWIVYPIDLSQALILKGNRNAFIGWTMGSRFLTVFDIHNIHISQYSKICNLTGSQSYIPSQPSPIPTPPPSPIPFPSSIPAPDPIPSPMSPGTCAGTIDGILGDCVAGHYVIQVDPVLYHAISFNNSLISLYGNLESSSISVANSSVTLNGNLYLNKGCLNIQNSSLQLKGNLNLVDVSISIDIGSTIVINHDVDFKGSVLIVIIPDNIHSGTYTIISFPNSTTNSINYPSIQSNCKYDIAYSKKSISIVLKSSNDCSSSFTIVIIIVVSLVAGALAIFMIIFGVWKCRKDSLQLDDLKVTLQK